jgi:hypothetical protein
MNIVKMVMLPKAIYTCSKIPIKIPMVFCTELEKEIMKYIWKHKRQFLSKKSNTESIKIPDLKLYYRAIIMKTA